MNNQSTYNLAKFEDGAVYFVKENAVGADPNNSIEKISAVINVKELKEHAQYQIVVLETDTGYRQEYNIHGVYLSPINILNIAVSHIKRDPSIMSGLERIT